MLRVQKDSSIFDPCLALAAVRRALGLPVNPLAPLLGFVRPRRVFVQKNESYAKLTSGGEGL
jgi:hypothetical protein